MRPYESLTAPAQARRLRRLATEALPKFDFPAGTPLTFVQHGENTTFRIDDPRRGRYLLRIHRAGYHTDAEIRGELAWLTALDADADVGAPVPRAGRDGAFVQHASAPGVPGARSVTVTRWVPGRFRFVRACRATHLRVGETAARLHAHASSWRRPRGFRRKRWDADGLVGPRAHMGDATAAPGIPAARRRRIAKIVDEARDALLRLDTDPASFGLIHADLHLGNVITHEGRARPIDFDDAGFGWPAFEWAVTLTWALGHERADDAKAAWLEGYERVRPMPAAQRDAFDLMVLVRTISMLGWCGSRVDHSRIRERLPLQAKSVVERGDAWRDGVPQTRLSFPKSAD